MRTKYRITPLYSLNAMTSVPETNYMLEKRVWGKWEGVQMYITHEQAEDNMHIIMSKENLKKSFPL